MSATLVVITDARGYSVAFVRSRFIAATEWKRSADVVGEPDTTWTYVTIDGKGAPIELMMPLESFLRAFSAA